MTLRAGRLRSALELGLLWTLAAAFRLPALARADAIHSDAAVVGLQAQHLLRGEWTWFVWGAGYRPPGSRLRPLFPLSKRLSFGAGGGPGLPVAGVPE